MIKFIRIMTVGNTYKYRCTKKLNINVNENIKVTELC